MPDIATDSLPSDTSTEVDSLADLEIFTTFYVPIRSLLITYFSLPNI